MKFSSYQRAVAPNIPNSPQVQAVRDPMTYGGEGKQYNDMAAAVGQITKVATKQQDDQDAADVIDARNKIMTSMTEQLYGENGLFTTAQGENAKGLTERTTQAARKTFDDVLKDYNGRVRYAAQGSMNENMANFQRIAASKEMDEKLATDKANYTSNLSLNTQNASYTWNVKNALTNYVNDGKRLVTAWGVKQGWSGARIQTELQNMVTQTAGGAAEAAITAEDYDRAEQILTVNRGEMNQDAYGKMMQVVNKHKQAKTYDTQAKDIFSQCWDGKNFDYAKAKQLAEAVYGQNAVTNKAGIDVKSAENMAWTDWGNKRMDNGTNGCVEAATKIAGYWSPWAAAEQKNGVLRVPDLVNDAAKEGGPGVIDYDESKLQNGDMIVYTSPREGADAHVVIYTGNGTGDYSYMGNSSGQNIMLKASDYREMDGQMPTRIIKTGAVGGEQRSAYDPEKLDKLNNMVDAMAQDAMRAQASQRKTYLDSLSRSLQGAGSYSAAVSILNSSDLDMKEKNALEGEAAEYYHVNRIGKPMGSSGRSGGNTSSKLNSAYKSLQALSINLSNGNSIGTSAYLTARAAGNMLDDSGALSDEQLEELRSNYQSSDFESQLTTDIEHNGLSGAYKNLTQNGMDPIVAAIMISKVDPSYLQKDYQGDQTEDGEGD